MRLPPGTLGWVPVRQREVGQGIRTEGGTREQEENWTRPNSAIEEYD